MTKIAVATKDGRVAPHFGHCPTYRIYDIDGGSVQALEEIANPGHEAGSPPDFLASLGADVVIAGGIGAGAITRFEGHGIQVIAGATGPADASVTEYLAGTLADAGSTCEGHAHAGHGHDHGHGAHGCGC